MYLIHVVIAVCDGREQTAAKAVYPFVPLVLSWQVYLVREGAKGFVFCCAFLRQR